MAQINFPRSSYSTLFNSSIYSLGDGINICILSEDGNLWLEQGVSPTTFFQALASVPEGWQPPPPRKQIDGNVAGFQPMGDPANPNPILVLGRDNNLWLEHAPFGTVPPKRDQVDTNVVSFQSIALDASTIYVLGTDGNLWLEQAPYGTIPPKRVQVDGNVAGFQALDDNNIVILGTDGVLWLEVGPWGTVPTRNRIPIANNVASFQAWVPLFLPGIEVGTKGIFVLGKDGTLWLEPTFLLNSVPPPPGGTKIDASVAAFQPVTALSLPALQQTTWIYVLGTDGNLWLEPPPFGSVPPARVQVDAKVADFQAIDSASVYVLDKSNFLWIENAPFSVPPPPAGGPIFSTLPKAWSERYSLIDGNVGFPLQIGRAGLAYYILTIIYAPPGTATTTGSSPNVNSVSYLTGSSTGTTVTNTHSFKDGTDISIEVQPFSVLKVGGDFNVSHTTTNSTSIQITKSQSTQIQVPGPNKDGIDHDYDRFYLWLNPIAEFVIDSTNKITWQLGYDGPAMIIQYVTVGWLKDPSTMPPSVKKLLDDAGLTEGDYKNILSTNPFSAGNSEIDSKRFSPLSFTIPYEPPVNPSDPVLPETINLTNSTINTKTESFELDYSVSMSLETGPIGSLLGLHLKDTTTLQWSDTNSQTQQEQSSQSASASIGSPSFSYSGLPDILPYWDTVYSSFMFAFPSQPPVAEGSILDNGGKPLAREPITLTVGGVKLSGRTDSKGEYRFYSAPTGEGQLTVKGQTFQVAIAENATKASLRLS